MLAEVTSGGTAHGRQSAATESEMAKAEPSRAAKPWFFFPSGKFCPVDPDFFTQIFPLGKDEGRASSASR
ncbi:hypothetical protein CBM2592_B110008 [Cupriavidus taiwanensis]|nr:hypothetical protein CBM2588_B140003 [Cupriavidus taiwanensis]SOY63444.1 hypothetical protein CBM2592_B110008 [Cupriavidus taiwanensis]SOY98446.1 hypothetical protein CBM2591_B90008 [Cupriavidus taiwanensis]SOZ77306.1 hypothetical protein CBM2617_U10076 [Cupriavidus taiwanensis]SOZ85310.1 hypothetical protein CBM2618_B130095 [Cupriavidus taiwanensis]